MSTNYHTAVSNGAAANASTVNSPLGQLDQAITNLAGGASIPNARLLEWALTGAWKMSAAPTYDGTYTNTISTVAVVWPDGSLGTYTATVINATWEEPTSWNITHATASKTVSSTGLVRNSDGQITTQPTYTVT